MDFVHEKQLNLSIFSLSSLEGQGVVLLLSFAHHLIFVHFFCFSAPGGAGETFFESMIHKTRIENDISEQMFSKD